MERDRPPRKALVLALGNPLVGADGFGCALLERLRRDPDLAEHAELADARTDLLAWIDRFADRDRVVLLDAALGAGASGEVLTLEEKDLGAFSETSPGAHQVSPVLALKLFRALYPEAPTRIALVALSVERLAVGPGRFPEAALDAACRAVRRLVLPGGA